MMYGFFQYLHNSIHQDGFLNHPVRIQIDSLDPRERCTLHSSYKEAITHPPRSAAFRTCPSETPAARDCTAAVGKAWTLQ